MVYTPALFDKAVAYRRKWIRKVQEELSLRGHTDHNLITYCENLFSDYAATHTPKQALERDLHQP